MIMKDQVTAKQRLAGLEKDDCCDKCEEPFNHNDESYEVRYGFICKRCVGH